VKLSGVKFEPQEENLMWLFMSHQNVTEQDCIDCLYPNTYLPELTSGRRMVNTYVPRIRKKLQKVGWTLKHRGWGWGWTLEEMSC